MSVLDPSNPIFVTGTEASRGRGSVSSSVNAT